MALSHFALKTLQTAALCSNISTGLPRCNGLFFSSSLFLGYDLPTFLRLFWSWQWLRIFGILKCNCMKKINIPPIYIYIYIYMCVCVCVCVWWFYASPPKLKLNPAEVIIWCLCCTAVNGYIIYIYIYIIFLEIIMI